MTNKISRRDFLKIGLFGMSAAALSRCAPQATPEPQAAGPSGTMVWWQPIDNHYAAFEFFRTKVPDFQSKYPQLQVELVEYPFVGFEAKFLAAFAGRENAPDIFVGLVAPWAGCVGVADPMPQDLVALCEKEVVGAFHNVMKYQGTWYGYPDGPTNGLGSMLFYNTEHFAAAGLSGPPQTMDELYEYSKLLAQVDGAGNVSRSGFAHRYDDARGAGTGSKIIPFLHAFGARIYDLANNKAEGVANSEAAVEALVFAQKLVKENLSSITLGKPEAQFAANQASMFFRESFMVGWLAQNGPDIKYEVSHVPGAVSDAMGATGVVDWAIMVNKFSERKDAAWDYIRTAVATKEGDLEASKLNGSPVAWKSNWDSEHMQSRRDYNALKYAADHYVDALYTHARHQELGDRHALAVQEILLLQKEPKQALDEAAKDMQAIMDKGPCG
jgi:ABC-type glycerol-3-phosphate transport system substrate-binding protein